MNNRRRYIILLFSLLVFGAFVIAIWLASAFFQSRVPVSGTISNLTIEGEVTELVDNGDGTWDVEFYFTVENAGGPGVRDIQAFLDLRNTFQGSDFNVNMILGYGGFTVNNGFDGVTNQGLLLGSNTLAAWQSAAVLVRVTFTPHNNQTTFRAPAYVVGVIDPTITSMRNSDAGGGQGLSSTSTTGTIGSASGGSATASSFSSASQTAAASSAQPGDSTEVIFGIPQQVTSSMTSTTTTVSSGTSSVSSQSSSISTSSVPTGIGNSGSTSSTGVFIWPGGKN